jgi:hypothetical protein
MNLELNPEDDMSMDLPMQSAPQLNKMPGSGPVGSKGSIKVHPEVP